MEWTFRTYPNVPCAGDGEVLLLSGDVGDTERTLARIALEKGLDGFLHGQGEARLLVLPGDPTLDDMLAASILESIVGRRPLGEGWKPIAEYAALVRKGLRPGNVPVEESLEGIYLAVRNAERGQPLTDEVHGGRFVERWRRLFRAILAAAERGKSPLVESFFDASEFAEERAYLARDVQLYSRDVAHRWLVRFPSGEAGKAIVLLRPKSLLFKHWGRELDDALFLAVSDGPGHWVFTTDPVQRISLQDLAQSLQTAERSVDSGAEADPWYDGERFSYSLVAAPRRGTRLPDRDVLRVVRKWLGASDVRAPSRNRARALVVASLFLCAALGAGVFSHLLGGRAEPEVEAMSRGRPLPSQALARVRVEGVDVPGFALIVACSLEPNPPVERASLKALKAACADARRLHQLLVGRYNFDPANIIVLADDTASLGGIKVDGPPDRESLSSAIDRLTVLTKAVDRSNFLFYYAGHGFKVDAADSIGYLVLQGFQQPYDVHGYDMGHLSVDIRRKISSTHKLLLVDCCFSGFATMQARGSRLADGEIFELWKNKAHVIITAGTADQLAWERGDQSEFTRCILRALGSEGTTPMADGFPRAAQGAPAGDGIVTDEELFRYLETELPKLGGKRRAQTPQYYRDDDVAGDDFGQFLFIPAPQ